MWPWSRWRIGSRGCPTSTWSQCVLCRSVALSAHTHTGTGHQRSCLACLSMCLLSVPSVQEFTLALPSCCPLQAGERQTQMLRAHGQAPDGGGVCTGRTTSPLELWGGLVSSQSFWLCTSRLHLPGLVLLLPCLKLLFAFEWQRLVKLCCLTSRQVAYNGHSTQPCKSPCSEGHNHQSTGTGDCRAEAAPCR